jgi:phage tail P2-like protein
MANDTLLADSIQHLPDYAAWDKLFEAMQADFDLGKLLIYIIDNVDSSLLEHLAWQYDVLGNKGFNLAQTDAQKRAIIKAALELHRYKGSVWSIKEALKSIGYGDAILIEGDNDSWANFSLKVTLGNRVLNGAEIDNVVKIVNQYKPARCVFVGADYHVVFDDSITADDVFSLEEADLQTDGITVGCSRLADGTYTANGLIDASQDADILVFY